ncbi:hypothetical protein FRC12_001476, partial [Ceratobasidium sp. 428]
MAVYVVFYDFNLRDAEWGDKQFWVVQGVVDYCNCSGFPNKTCTISKYYDSSIGGYRAGTYLKKGVFENVLELDKVDGTNEWFVIRPGPNSTVTQLGQDLVQIGNGFTTVDLGYSAAQKPNDTNRAQSASWALAEVGVAMRQHIQNLGHQA